MKDLKNVPVFELRLDRDPSPEEWRALLDYLEFLGPTSEAKKSEEVEA